MSQFLGIDVPHGTILAAAAGDASAHAAIYRDCHRAVHTLIRRLVPRAAVADELLQEVFVEILRSVATYSGDGSFGGWVRSIAVNKCLTYLRSPWHRSLFWVDAQPEDDPAPLVLIDAALQPDAQATARADLERALGQLPALSRSVVWLHDVEGYTHHEIGALLDRTPSFSKSQLARAHIKLRELLDPVAKPLPATRRLRFAAVVAAAGSVALLIVIGIEMLHRSSTAVAPQSTAVAPPATTLDQLVAQSRRLDDMLQELPERSRVERVAQAATIDTLEQRIQWLDFQLSYQPAAGFSQEQARQLWRERVDLMDSLVKVRYAQVQNL